MKKYVLIAVLMFWGITTCKAQNKNTSDFVPEGHVIFEKHYGDLNNDGQQDCILIIKKTNQANVVVNRFDKKVDRNRRGIIVLFKKQDDYQLADKNYDCFSSENEDGGVYFPPQLWIDVEKGNLVIHYSHGRYGFWRYIFRYQNSGFKLIGYDSSSSNGPVVNRETSINFLTKQKLIRENTYESSQGEDEVFEETREEIVIDTLLELSEINDFDELDMSIY